MEDVDSPSFDTIITSSVNLNDSVALCSPSTEGFAVDRQDLELGFEQDISWSHPVTPTEEDRDCEAPDAHAAVRRNRKEKVSPIPVVQPFATRVHPKRSHQQQSYVVQLLHRAFKSGPANPHAADLLQHMGPSEPRMMFKDAMDDRVLHEHQVAVLNRRMSKYEELIQVRGV